jgi:hypothetical protein
MVFSTGAGVDLQNKQAMGKVGRSAIRIAKSHILGRSGEPVIPPADEEVAPYTSRNFDRVLPNCRHRIVNCLGFFLISETTQLASSAQGMLILSHCRRDIKLGH